MMLFRVLFTYCFRGKSLEKTSLFTIKFRQQLKHRFSDRMSVVPNSNEFFIYEKFEVQKCPRTDISERWHPVPLLKVLDVQKVRL